MAIGAAAYRLDTHDACERTAGVGDGDADARRATGGCLDRHMVGDPAGWGVGNHTCGSHGMAYTLKDMWEQRLM